MRQVLVSNTIFKKLVNAFMAVGLGEEAFLLLIAEVAFVGWC